MIIGDAMIPFSRLTSRPNFINILCVLFSYKKLAPKITKPKQTQKKAAEKTFIPKRHIQNVDEIDHNLNDSSL
jgi:hypothetical protein